MSKVNTMSPPPPSTTSLSTNSSDEQQGEQQPMDIVILGATSYNSGRFRSLTEEFIKSINLEKSQIRSTHNGSVTLGRHRNGHQQQQPLNLRTITDHQSIRSNFNGSTCSSSPSSSIQTNSSINEDGQSINEDLDVGLKIVTMRRQPLQKQDSNHFIDQMNRLQILTTTSGCNGDVDTFPPPPPVPPKTMIRQSSSSSSINGSSSSLSSSTSSGTNQSHTLTRDSGNSSLTHGMTNCNNTSPLRSCCHQIDTASGNNTCESQLVHATCVQVSSPSQSRRSSHDRRRPSQDSRSSSSRRPSQCSNNCNGDQAPPLPPKTIPPPLPPKTFKKQSSSGLLGITLRPPSASANQRRSSAATGSVHSDPRSSTLCTSISTGGQCPCNGSCQMMMTAGVASSSSTTAIVGINNVHGSNGCKTMTTALRPRSNESVIPSMRSSNYNSSCQQQHHQVQHQLSYNGGQQQGQINPLFELDVRKYLIYKSPGEDGPDIKGGPPDALLVKATEVTKNDFMFDEAFLTTYRTFLTPKEVIDKLLFRYNKFIHSTDPQGIKAATNSFSLLVRVVDELCVSDCSQELLNSVFEFVYQLVTQGQLPLARALRAKVMDKMETRSAQLMNQPVILPSLAISTKVVTIHDFKPDLIAEQLTLIDSQLFNKIDVAEMLFASQGDNKSNKSLTTPNINKFTDHFNHFAYWVRSKILLEEDYKSREKLYSKFIKIMKHLKKLNNFNSIIAITSALESAPVRRLDWSKHLLDSLKEFESLSDSTSSFRSYRNILHDVEPPCVPYLGLTLQDLTFIQVGNEDMLPSDGVNVNFSKRWLQFEILDQLRRIRNCHYTLTRNEEVQSYFNNFEDFLDEESMWQISESLKPRNHHNATSNCGKK